MECSKIPSSMAKKAIMQTRKTGNEHAFVTCPNGETGELLVGNERKVTIKNHCQRGERVAIFHTHPNGTLRLSDQDREVLAAEDVSSVCVAVPNGDVVCERSKPTCTSKVNL